MRKDLEELKSKIQSYKEENKDLKDIEIFNKCIEELDKIQNDTESSIKSNNVMLFLNTITCLLGVCILAFFISKSWAITILSFLTLSAFFTIIYIKALNKKNET